MRTTSNTNLVVSVEKGRNQDGITITMVDRDRNTMRPVRYYGEAVQASPLAADKRLAMLQAEVRNMRGLPYGERQRALELLFKRVMQQPAVAPLAPEKVDQTFRVMEKGSKYR